MKFKINLSEKFLWDLYKVYEKFGDFLNLPPRNMYDVIYPEFKKIKNKWQTEKDKKRFRNLIYYLKIKGLIKDSKEISGWLLTPKGGELVLKLESKFKEYKKRKDGKWIMVVFDIPEKMKRKREIFRRKIKSMEFKMLQKSIWVCSFDVVDDINEFIEKLFLRPYIKIFFIEEIK